MGKTEGKKQFVVGGGPNADFSQSEIDLLAYKIAEWFNSDICDRNYPDPLEAAKTKIKECLLAETAAGKPWQSCPDLFEDRIMAKTLYDMRTGEGKGAPRRKSPQATRKLDPDAASGAKDVMNSDPVLAIVNQEEIRKETVADVLDSFPELDNAAHLPNVRRLGNLYAQAQVIEMKLQMSNSAVTQDQLLQNLERVDKMIERTMKTLGIHPQQVQKKIDDRAAMSVADFVALVEDDDDFRALNKIWAQELALLLWWMANHPNGRGTGPNVHPWEIWHFTRSKPFNFTCSCGKEYKHLLDGFEPDELFDYLVQEGRLVEDTVKQVQPFIEAVAGERIEEQVLSQMITEVHEHFGEEETDGEDTDSNE